MTNKPDYTVHTALNTNGCTIELRKHFNLDYSVYTKDAKGVETIHVRDNFTVARVRYMMEASRLNQENH